MRLPNARSDYLFGPIPLGLDRGPTPAHAAHLVTVVKSIMTKICRMITEASGN